MPSAANSMASRMMVLIAAFSLIVEPIARARVSALNS